MTATWVHTIDGSELDQSTMDRLYDEERAEREDRGDEPMMVVYWNEDEPEFYVRKADR